jgi:hypothetical protein
MAFRRLEFLQRGGLGPELGLVRALLRGELAHALLAALSPGGLAREPPVEIADEPVDGLGMVRGRRSGLLAGQRAGLPRQHLVEPADRRVARREAVMQVPLLALQLGDERRIVFLELAQAADVGAVGGADQVRQHVHVAEDALDDVLVRLRMRQRRPVGARNVTLLERLVP